MNRNEITACTRAALERNKSDLTTDEIINFSMGIPQLVDQLCQIGVSSKTASWIVGGYFYDTFKNLFNPNNAELFSKYLQIIPNKQMIERFGDLFLNKNIYTELYYVQMRAKQFEKTGIHLDSPFFTAPESEEIYSTMLKNKENAWIDIYAPALSEVDLEAFRIASDFDKGSCRYGGFSYSRDRLNMFGASYRKVTFWQRDSEGQEFLDHTDPYWGEAVAEEAAQFASEHLLGNYQIPTDANQKCSVLVHCHDHHELVSNPIRVGWAFESMFQQRKIPYFVRNRVYGANYSYNPETNHIQLISSDE